MKNRPTYALITGASQGLGRSYALELAKRGVHVLLVSKKDEGLPQLRAYIKDTYHVESHYFEANLINIQSLKKMVQWVVDNYSIHILINNAGIGGSIKFEKSNPNYVNDIIQLNIRALSYITHQLLPTLRSSGRPSYILNVSSMAAFCPIGYKMVYPASKKFIQYFTKGLNYELKSSNVSAAAVFPGPMKTNKDITKRIENQGAFVKICLQSPDRVARVSLDMLFHGKTFIIVGFLNKINWFLFKIVPTGLMVPLLSSFIKRELNIEHKGYGKPVNI